MTILFISLLCLFSKFSYLNINLFYLNCAIFVLFFNLYSLIWVVANINSASKAKSSDKQKTLQNSNSMNKLKTSKVKRMLVFFF